MSIGTLTIGPVNYEFDKLDTELLDKKNISRAIKQWSKADYHTSLHDLKIKEEEVDDLLSSITQVKFLDLNEVYKQSPHVLIKIVYLVLTNFSHLVASNRKELYDLFVKYQFRNEYFNYQPQSTTNKNKLWIAGCSLSAPNNVPVDTFDPGDPYVEDHERWGHILANDLGREEMNIARRGSSVLTGLQQIMKADITPDDILVWQITSLTRTNLIGSDGYFRPFSAEKDHNYVQAVTSKRFLTDMHQDILSLNYIKMGIDYCKQNNIKLFVVNMLANNKILSPVIDNLNLLTNFIDYGADGSHPGPKQNAKYAKEIIKYIQGE